MRLWCRKGNYIHSHLLKREENTIYISYYISMAICIHRNSEANLGVTKQESVSVECVPPTCQPYVFWWLPLGVRTGRGHPRSHGIPPPLDIFPTFPPPLDIPVPWTVHPYLLVSPGGHHWKHIPPHLHRIIDTYENITFPQLRWRAVIILTVCSAESKTQETTPAISF